MKKIILTLFCLFMIPLFFGTVDAQEFLGNNILDYTRSTQISGNNNIFSNSTGVYITGNGTIYIEFNNHNNTSIHFNTQNFNSDDSIVADTYYNRFDDSDLLVDGMFSYFTNCPQTGLGSGPINAPYRIHTCYDIYGNVGFTHTIVSIAQTNYSTTFYSVTGFPTITAPANDFTLQNMEYNIFALITTDGSETIQIRSEIHRPNPLIISNFTNTVFSDRIQMNWDCPVYDGIGYTNGCTNISKYKIMRDNILIAETTTPSYTDSSFSFDIDYNYSIITVNNLNAESTPYTIQISSLPQFHSPDLQLTHNGNSITISWTDPYPDVTQFKVMRLSDGMIWTVPATQNTITDDSNIVLTDTYSYQIQSRNATIINNYSNTFSINYPSIRTMDVTYRTVFDTLYLTPTITTNENGYGTLTKFSVRFNPDTQLHNIPYTDTIGNSAIKSYPEMEFTVSENIIQILESVTIQADFTDGDDPQKTITTTTLAMPSYQPDFSGSGTSATQSSFNDDSFSFYLKKDISPYSISCRYADNTNSTTSWHNSTVNSNTDNFYFLNINTTSSKTYVDCWNQNGLKIFSNTFNNNSNMYGFASLNSLDDAFGSFAGVSIPLLFVVFLGAVFTSKNAHMGLIVLGAAIGFMGLLGLLTIDPLMWGLIVLLVILGLLTGRKA